MEKLSFSSIKLSQIFTSWISLLDQVCWFIENSIEIEFSQTYLCYRNVYRNEAQRKKSLVEIVPERDTDKFYSL